MPVVKVLVLLPWRRYEENIARYTLDNIWCFTATWAEIEEEGWEAYIFKGENLHSSTKHWFSEKDAMRFLEMEAHNRGFYLL